jgi:membrane-associated phospholipid phosphatase
LKNSIDCNTTDLFVRNKRKLWIWVIAITIGVFLLIGAFLVDGPVHRWQQKHRWKNIQLLSRNVTRGTDWPTHMIIGLVLAGIAWRRGNPKWTRVFLCMILAAALAGITAYGLKITTGRVRPSVKVEKVWRGPETRQNYQSFPSGHTAFSTGFFAVLFFVCWRLGLLCLPIPLFVGFTRIFLGAHYLSDVVASILLGVLAAALVAEFVLWREKPFSRAA